MSSRLERDWFERVARPLENIASKTPEGVDPEQALSRVLEASRFLRYKILPHLAPAILKAILGSREPLLAPAVRRYLKKLTPLALAAVRTRALPPKPSGRQYNLAAYEERRLLRAFHRLTRFFEEYSGAKVSRADLNIELETLYPAQGRRVSREFWPNVLAERTPRRRAMTVLGDLYPLGQKAIQRRIHATERLSKAGRVH